MDEKQKGPGGNRIVVFYGGASSEREVSLVSGSFVHRTALKLGYDVVAVDVKDTPLSAVTSHRADKALVLLHGGWGENGVFQSLLELSNIPYSGSRPLAAGIAMDKALSKRLFDEANIPTPKWCIINSTDEFKHAVKSLKGPWIIKPISEGSSVGIQVINTADDLSLVEVGLRKYQSLIVEEFLSGSILTVAIIDTKDVTRVLPALQIVPTKAIFYNSEAKDEGFREYIQFPLNDQVNAEVCETAWRAHKTLGCSGITRVDLILSFNKAYVLEVNTIPGMGPKGNLITSCEANGISKEELVEYLIASIK